jgi:hypothetical protein
LASIHSVNLSTAMETCVKPLVEVGSCQPHRSPLGTRTNTRDHL